MSVQNKLDLISRLTNAVKTDLEQEKSDFYKAFGGWDKNESAEDLIETIKGSRIFNRIIDDFDLLIGSTAVSFDLTMVTNNTSHFNRLSEIKLEDWTFTP